MKTKEENRVVSVTDGVQLVSMEMTCKSRAKNLCINTIILKSYSDYIRIEASNFGAELRLDEIEDFCTLLRRSAENSRKCLQENIEFMQSMGRTIE